MKKIVIIGAGGMARELKSLINEINRRTPEWHFVGYVVSDLNALTDRDSRNEVMGDYGWLREHANEIDAIALGIGTPELRLEVSREIRACFRRLSSRRWCTQRHVWILRARKSAKDL